MKIVCTICTDAVTEDFSAAPCGHTFHYTCLSQWLSHQKTCPQCREKCLPRNIVKLFINSSEPDTQATFDSLNPVEMKDELELQARVLTQKEKALSEARETLSQVRDELQAWQSQHTATQKRLKKEQSTSTTLKEQLKVMQYECDQATESRKEAEKLKRKLSSLTSVQRVLSGSREEVETLVKSASSATSLASFVVALKHEYGTLKDKLKEKEQTDKELRYARKQLQLREAELRSCRHQLSAVEGDLALAEQEKDNLQRKVEVLQRALESPGSRLALRRILESPMPDGPSHRPPADDLGASPLLLTSSQAKAGSLGPAAGSSVTVDTDGNQPALLESVGSKRLNTDDLGGVLLPVRKVTKYSSQSIASGFNGMGGHSNFVIPKSKPQKPVGKGLKFAPRMSSNPKFKQQSLRL